MVKLVLLLATVALSSVNVAAIWDSVFGEDGLEEIFSYDITHGARNKRQATEDCPMIGIWHCCSKDSMKILKGLMGKGPPPGGPPHPSRRGPPGQGGSCNGGGPEGPPPDGTPPGDAELRSSARGPKRGYGVPSYDSVDLVGIRGHGGRRSHNGPGSGGFPGQGGSGRIRRPKGPGMSFGCMLQKSCMPCMACEQFKKMNLINEDGEFNKTTQATWITDLVSKALQAFGDGGNADSPLKEEDFSSCFEAADALENDINERNCSMKCAMVMTCIMQRVAATCPSDARNNQQSSSDGVQEDGPEKKYQCLEADKLKMRTCTMSPTCSTPTPTSEPSTP